MNAAILDIDMGNTRIKWRCGIGDNTCVGANDYSGDNWLDFSALVMTPERVRISCVVKDKRRRQIEEYVHRRWRLPSEFASVRDQCAGVTQAYPIKENLGVDRWLGLLAAYHQLGSCVLVSCGSAVTVDLLLESGEHAGGYIVPGIRMMHASLFSGTDAVKVSVDNHLVDLSPGRDTGDAVNRGVVAMITSLVNHAGDIYQKKQGNRPAFLITGGDGETVRKFLNSNSIYNPYLVLDGLALALP